MDFESSYIFSIDSYLKENYPLFALMGIFSAFTIYLSRDFPRTTFVYDGVYLKIGTLASILLITYVAALLNVNAYRKFVSRSNFKRKTLPRFGKLIHFLSYILSMEGVNLLILLLLINTIVATVMLVGLLLSETFYILSAILSVWLGVKLADETHGKLFDFVCGEVETGTVTKEWIGNTAFPLIYLAAVSVVYYESLLPKAACMSTIGNHCIVFEPFGLFVLQWTFFGVVLYSLFSISLMSLTTCYLWYLDGNDGL